MYFCKVIIEFEFRVMSNKVLGLYYLSVFFYWSCVMINRGNRFIYFGKGFNL